MVLIASFESDCYDVDEQPRYWCEECRAYRFTRADVDGYPICRVCSNPEERHGHPNDGSAA